MAANKKGTDQEIRALHHYLH